MFDARNAVFASPHDPNAFASRSIRGLEPAFRRRGTLFGRSTPGNRRHARAFRRLVERFGAPAHGNRASERAFRPWFHWLGAGRGQFARVASQFASPNIEFCAVAEEFPWIFRDFAARVHEVSPANHDFRRDAQSFVASARPFITKEAEISCSDLHIASRGALSRR